MTNYPEDDPSLLNPNRLEGHEGYMIKLLDSKKAYSGCGKGDNREAFSKRKHKEIPASSIVMIVDTWYDDEYDYNGWVDVLHEGERLRIYYQPNQWMAWAVPWPHGAFIQVL